MDALDGIDRAIGSLLKAARHTGRGYRLVVLSDHGQSLGATFQQRFGKSLEEVIAGLLPRTTTVVGTTGSVESAGIGRRIAAELSRGSVLGPLLARRLRRALGLPGLAAAVPPDVVVCSSGSLAHVYFTSEPGRMTAEAIETRHTGLIEALAGHPGIGALLVRSAAGQPLVVGSDGRLDVSAGEAEGSDLTADYGPRAAENLRHLDGVGNVGDLILLGAVDRDSGEVTGFEELVGSHGGLGGWQSDPFILCPAGWTLADDPPVGAPAVYRQLVAWQAQLRAGFPSS
jgi:hypothetical protein